MKHSDFTIFKFMPERYMYVPDPVPPSDPTPPTDPTPPPKTLT